MVGVTLRHFLSGGKKPQFCDSGTLSLVTSFGGLKSVSVRITEVDNSSGAKQKKSSLGILKYLSVLFPSGAERFLFPIFGENTNIIILGGVVIIILKLLETIFFSEKPSR